MGDGLLLSLATAAVRRADALGGALLVHEEARPAPGDPLATSAAWRGGRILLWEGSGWLLAGGRAVETRCDGPGRSHALAAAAARWSVQAGPGAPLQLLGALAFEDRSPPSSPWGRPLPGARLLLPRRWWRVEGRRAWRGAAVAVVAAADAAAVAAQLAEALADEGADHAPSVDSTPWPELASTPFTDLAAEAVALMRHGALRKVVLARACDVPRPQPIDPVAVLERLHAQSDAATCCHLVDLDDGAVLLGATPELLFDLREGRLQTMALAGSRRREAEPRADRAAAKALLASTKDRKEHNLVVEHLQTVLEGRAEGVHAPDTPALRRLARLWHLETRIAADGVSGEGFDLLGALHPTPAVCGLPTPAAAAYIRRHEGLHRGLYTGALGSWRPGATRWVVPLRGGIVRGRQARLYAGAGLVESSEPLAEEAEVVAKLEVMAGCL